MFMNWLPLLMTCILLPLSGCISDVSDVDVSDSESESSLNRMNIVAQTLDREVDGYNEYNVLENSSGQNTLILWAASGCRGCHEWTEMIRESVANGTISNESKVITVQRYPSFESGSHSSMFSGTTRRSSIPHGPC